MDKTPRNTCKVPKDAVSSQGGQPLQDWLEPPHPIYICYAVKDKEDAKWEWALQDTGPNWIGQRSLL